MTTLLGAGLASEHGLRGGFFVAANVAPVESQKGDPIFEIDAPVDEARWTGIVVHHLGLPAGDADSIDRQHRAEGFAGMGYHFVIGNGNGLADGVIQVGYRWNEQKPGVHVYDQPGEYHNLHSIGICLVGNGNRRPFTDRQMLSLVALVQRLQGRLSIGRDHVWLHTDLVTDAASPGKFFPVTTFEEQLLD